MWNINTFVDENIEFRTAVESEIYRINQDIDKINKLTMREKESQLDNLIFFSHKLNLLNSCLNNNLFIKQTSFNNFNIISKDTIYKISKQSISCTDGKLYSGVEDFELINEIFKKVKENSHKDQISNILN